MQENEREQHLFAFSFIFNLMFVALRIASIYSLAGNRAYTRACCALVSLFICLTIKLITFIKCVEEIINIITLST